MIGSLEQFIGKINHKEFFSTHRQSTKSQSHRGYTAHPSECKIQQKTCFLSNMHDQPCPATLAPNHSSSPKTKKSQRDVSKEGLSLETVQLQQMTKSSQCQKKDASVKDYVAWDKLILLQNYNKHIKLIQSRKQEVLAATNTNDIPLVTTARDTPDTKYHRIKGKLSQKHQILRSMVRVEEMDTTNIKTFFEISFERVNEQFNKLRLKNTDRGQLVEIKEAVNEQRKGESYPTLSQRHIPDTQSKGIRNKPKTQRHNPKKKYILNSQRWSSSTVSSAHQTQQQKDHSPSNRSKTQEPSRQSILKRIKDILTNPKRPCKRILNHS